MAKFNIKGMRNRILFDINDYDDFMEAYHDLDEQLEKSDGFYKNSHMKAVVKGKELNQLEKYKIRELLETKYGFRTLFIGSVNNKKKNESARFIHGTVRSGQLIEERGHVIVLGDTNDGSEIKAGGNIIIMGRTNGLLHAGYPNNDKAIVAAIRMESLQIRIGKIISRAPDTKRYRADVPEIAYTNNGKIILEPLNPKSKML